MAVKGDIVEVRADQSGEHGRRGLVLATIGNMLKIRWDDDHESMFIPGPGTVTVVRHDHVAQIGTRAKGRKASA